MSRTDLDTTTVALVPLDDAQALGPVLSDAARDFAAQALAPGTLRSYRIKARLWREWAEARGLPVMPARPTDVGSWLAELAESGPAGGKRLSKGRTGQALGSLRIAVAALKFVHRTAGEDFRADHPAISLVLKGISRTRVEEQAQAKPLTGATLVELIQGFDPRDPFACRDAAILAIGYAFGRRRSEIVGLDLDTLGTGDGVLLRDVKTLTVRLYRHKTMGSDGQPAEFVIPRAGNGLTVNAIERWLRMAKVRPGEPIIRGIDRHGNIRLDRLSSEYISDLIKRRVRQHFIRQGVDPKVAGTHAVDFSGHSLRVGLAVTAADAGADIRAIQTALGHVSPSMSIRYAKRADALKSSVHNLAGVGLDAKVGDDG